MDMAAAQFAASLQRYQQALQMAEAQKNAAARRAHEEKVKEIEEAVRTYTSATFYTSAVLLQEYALDRSSVNDADNRTRQVNVDKKIAAHVGEINNALHELFKLFNERVAIEAHLARREEYKEEKKEHKQERNAMIQRHKEENEAHSAKRPRANNFVKGFVNGGEELEGDVSIDLSKSMVNDGDSHESIRTYQENRKKQKTSPAFSFVPCPPAPAAPPAPAGPSVQVQASFVQVASPKSFAAVPPAIPSSGFGSTISRVLGGAIDFLAAK